MVQGEIMLARSETRPTSRQQLADIVRERTGMPFNEAFAFVDTYCEENEPGVPGYLQEEFAVPYLKVVAVVNVLIGVFLIYRGVQLYHTERVSWGWYCGGVLFCGAAAFAWVQSLEREVLWRKRKGR
jgi:hypothetical protein